MVLRSITEQDKEKFNKVVTHPLQSYEWGEFRKKTGVRVTRKGVYEDNTLVDGFQLTIHPLPKTDWTIGYIPKGNMPTEDVLQDLRKIGKEQKCIFIQLEPNVRKHELTTNPLRPVEDEASNSQLEPKAHQPLAETTFRPSAHPLFTKYTFQLNLTQSEEQLLENMHPKTRYNIKIAKRHGVEISEDNSDEAFERYWELTKETTSRQGFYAHDKKYHLLQWQTFPHTKSPNALSSHLFVAKYQGKILTTMLFFIFHDTLYYPYGASSNESRNVMHSTLTMWEAILFGKKMGLKKFDMWGALNQNPSSRDPWIGFHTFKERFGPEHVEFIGSYDLVIHTFLYQGYKIADKLRWLLLRLKK